MHVFIFIAAFVFVALTTPLKFALALCALLLSVTLVVKVSAQVVAGTSPALGDSFRAVLYSSLLVGLGLLAFMIYSGSTLHQVEGTAAWAVLAGLFVVYALGFQMGLGTSPGASALIAFIASLLSGAVLWSVKGLLV